VQGQLSELKKLWRSPRMLLSQSLNLAMIVFSALMIWKGLMFLTKSESPVVVVLRYVDAALSLCPPVSRSAAVCLVSARVAWVEFVLGWQRRKPVPAAGFVLPLCASSLPFLEASETAFVSLISPDKYSLCPLFAKSSHPPPILPPTPPTLQWVHGARLPERRHFVSQQPRRSDPRGGDRRVQDQGP